MPKIEQYNITQRQDAPNIALAGERATAEAFGAGTARQIGQVGQIVENVAGKVIDREMQLADMSDKNSAQDAYNKFESSLIAKRSELTRLKGLEAEKSSELLNKFIEDQTRAFSESLGNNYQRELFGVSAGRLSNTYREQILKFRDAMIEDNNKNLILANLDNIKNTAMGDWSNPEAIIKGLNDTDTQIAALNKGEAPEIVQQRQLLAGDNYITQIAKGILADPNGGAIKAKNFLDQYGETMTPAGKLAIYDDISKKADMEKIIGVANTLVDVKDPKVINDALTKNFGKDPAMFSKAKTFLDDFQKDKAKARENAIAEEVDKVALQIATSKDSRNVSIPVNLPFETQEKLFNFQRKSAERQTTGSVTIPSVYASLVDQIRNGENADVLGNLNNLTVEDAKSLINMSSQARNKDPEFSRVMTFEEQKKLAYTALKLDPKDKKSAPKIIAFNQELQKLLPQDKKKWTIELVQEAIDKLVEPVDVSLFPLGVSDSFRFMLPYADPKDKKVLYEAARSETLKKEDAEFYPSVKIGGKVYTDVYVTKAGKKGVIRNINEDIVGSFSYTEGK